MCSASTILFNVCFNAPKSQSESSLHVITTLLCNKASYLVETFITSPGSKLLRTIFISSLKWTKCWQATQHSSIANAVNKHKTIATVLILSTLELQSLHCQKSDHVISIRSLCNVVWLSECLSLSASQLKKINQDTFAQCQTHLPTGQLTPFNEPVSSDSPAGPGRPPSWDEM